MEIAGKRNRVMQLRRLAHPAGIFLALAFSLLLSVHVQAAETCSQSYIDSLPTPTPGPGAIRVVQMVNCSNQTILGAANAAMIWKHLPYPVFPREGTWVMKPYGSANNANVLTIDIPSEWANTKCTEQEKAMGCKANAPNFWVRTGCRYDPVTDRAQCETGGCGGQYDCSSGGFGSPPFTTILEDTFAVPTNGYSFDYPDISAVNGVNLNVEVEPVGGSDLNPNAPTDNHWLKYNYPLVVHGADLRAANSCASNFLLKRADVDKSKDVNGNTLYGYVIIDQSGTPVMPAGNNTLACFSNCGYYKYPYEPPANCNPQDPNDPKCYAWMTFCAYNGGLYGGQCTTDADCVRNDGGLDIHAACWKFNPSDRNGVCSLRAFYKNAPSSCPGGITNASPTSSVACSFYYGSINPLTQMKDYSTQPPTLPCSQVIGPNGSPVACVGDDTLHKVLHGAYTWPNDPEVFSDDSKLVRIIASPGGSAVPITPATAAIPLCESLPSNYDYSDNLMNCSISVNHQGAVFGLAKVSFSNGIWESNGMDWACNLDQRGAGNEGVICRWRRPPTTKCTPPVIDDYVTKSACGVIESGTSLQSSMITPAANDPLFVSITVAELANPVTLPRIAGCVTAWTGVKSQFINTNQGVVVWYMGRATGAACKVTVTLSSPNPAAMKVYDIPSANGTVDAKSSAIGRFVSGSPIRVTAGTVATTHQPDLGLVALLQVNQNPTPITYWNNWLTNSTGANCINPSNGRPDDNYCPTDDGTDYLPGHGPYSSNTDAGHEYLDATGSQILGRDAQNLGPFNWGGVAIYIQLR